MESWEDSETKGVQGLQRPMDDTLGSTASLTRADQLDNYATGVLRFQSVERFSPTAFHVYFSDRAKKYNHMPRVSDDDDSISGAKAQGK